MKWLTINDPDELFIIVVPETDTLPHAHIKNKKWKKASLAGSNCPCNPKIQTGDKDGVFPKPILIHNSFETSELTDNAISKLST